MPSNAAWFEEARQVFAVAELGDAQLDGARARVPVAVAISVALVSVGIRRHADLQRAERAQKPPLAAPVSIVIRRVGGPFVPVTTDADVNS